MRVISVLFVALMLISCSTFQRGVDLALPIGELEGIFEMNCHIDVQENASQGEIACEFEMTGDTEDAVTAMLAVCTLVTGSQSKCLVNLGEDE